MGLEEGAVGLEEEVVEERVGDQEEGEGDSVGDKEIGITCLEVGVTIKEDLALEKESC